CCSFDLEDRKAGFVAHASCQDAAKLPDRLEAGRVALPDIDLPRAGALVAEINTPVNPARQTRRGGGELVAEMHPRRMQQRFDAPAEREELHDVDGLADDVNVEIAPGHEIERVAADDVHL